MNAWMTRLLTAGLVFGLLAAPAGAAPTVKDEGHFFSDVAKEQANKVIAEIEHDFKKDVFIEAYTKVPPEKAERWQRDRKDAGSRGRFFKEWAEERFKSHGTNGILVLLYREAAKSYFVEVVVGPNTLKKDFLEEDAKALQHNIRKEFDNTMAYCGCNSVDEITPDILFGWNGSNTAAKFVS